MTLEIDTHAEDAQEQIDAAMKRYPYALARFFDEEAVQVFFGDSESEMKPILARQQTLPGKTTYWAKAN